MNKPLGFYYPELEKRKNILFIDELPIPTGVLRLMKLGNDCNTIGHILIKTRPELLKIQGLHHKHLNDLTRCLDLLERIFRKHEWEQTFTEKNGT